MNTSEIKHDIASQAILARAILQKIAETSDEETTQIVIDSETTLIEAITSALDRIDALEAHSEALAQRIKTMQQRKAYFADSVEALRASIRVAMETCDAKKIEIAEATVYLRSAPDRVEIIDATRIPAKYMRQPDPVVDRTSLTKDMRLGVVVPGAQIQSGGNTIAIRR